ncbi:immunoglobulin lambda-1 light chain-like [Centropristis striata]|uniref:immunoglobulin lambda-1 light chain-like n=1 Tax=Centropristis striata TaxID=184440 RepID=UPI0027DFB361|nr:immunoglobulin lambda-1 light chain-like [Centropristis striata]
MLFLPAAALCCLCSALAAMARQLLQEDLTWRTVGERVSFSCRGTKQCFGSVVVWFQKRDTETFTLILMMDRHNGIIDKSYNHPQEDDFSAVNNQNGWELQIKSVKLNHSATYYCCCLKRYYYIFGSGTKLFVVDQQVVKPVVSVYPAAPRAHLEGKSSLLCLASAMFPPLVGFSWKRRKENGPLEELPPAEGEQLELRESGRTAAILLLRQQENSTYKYRCYVQHEGGQVEAPTEQEVPAPAASCPPEREPADLPALEQADWSFQSQCRVKLLCLLYTVLIVKSLVFCCGLSLLMILRNKGPSTNCTHAD